MVGRRRSLLQVLQPAVEVELAKLYIIKCSAEATHRGAVQATVAFVCCLINQVEVAADK